MKKILLLSSFIIGLNYLTAQTTEEEYNYITKGYSYQQRMGLDMKKGYILIDDSTNTTTGERNVKILEFRRITGDSTELAAYMVIYDKIGYGREYICIPHPKSNNVVINNFYNSLVTNPNLNSSFKLQAIILAMTKYLNWK